MRNTLPFIDVVRKELGAINPDSAIIILVALPLFTLVNSETSDHTRDAASFDESPPRNLGALSCLQSL